ncbi:MAG TPA: hypothetical protein VFL73_12820 [Solirubrobacteraceae bacterium]|nr:hypothetical protein [Solirubrobacteraceae bacterium]
MRSSAGISTPRSASAAPTQRGAQTRARRSSTPRVIAAPAALTGIGSEKNFGARRRARCDAGCS